jgi:hypothetical protein
MRLQAEFGLRSPSFLGKKVFFIIITNFQLVDIMYNNLDGESSRHTVCA